MPRSTSLALPCQLSIFLCGPSSSSWTPNTRLWKDSNRLWIRHAIWRDLKILSRIEISNPWEFLRWLWWGCAQLNLIVSTDPISSIGCYFPKIGANQCLWHWLSFIVLWFEVIFKYLLRDTQIYISLISRNEWFRITLCVVKEIVLLGRIRDHLVTIKVKLWLIAHTFSSLTIKASVWILVELIGTISCTDWHWCFPQMLSRLVNTYSSWIYD